MEYGDYSNSALAMTYDEERKDEAKTQQSKNLSLSSRRGYGVVLLIGRSVCIEQQRDKRIERDSAD